MKMIPLCFAVCFLCSLVSIRAFSADCTALTVQYNERIPYARQTEKGVEGLTATPASFAFSKAGIPFKWENTPSKRQMKMIEENTGCDCAIGWFKNPDREKIAKFTQPIYQDKPYIALARVDNDKLHTGMDVETLLSDPDLTLEVKDGYSYGPYLDSQITLHQPKTDTTTTENLNMLKKIYAKYADYFFIAPEEADELIRSSGLPQKSFKYVTFSNMPEGEKRFLMCSKRVDDTLIDTLNAAILEYTKTYRK